MAAPTELDQPDFWETLSAALWLQHTASCLAARGEREDAAAYERWAIALLLEITRTLQADEPALGTVRKLAAAGLARLDALKPQRRSRTATAATRGRRQRTALPAPQR